MTQLAQDSSSTTPTSAIDEVIAQIEVSTGHVADGVATITIDVKTTLDSLKKQAPSNPDLVPEVKRLQAVADRLDAVSAHLADLDAAVAAPKAATASDTPPVVSAQTQAAVGASLATGHASV